jgi:hypothetical protein
LATVVCHLESQQCMMKECTSCDLKWQAFYSNFDEELLDTIAPTYRRWDTSDGQVVPVNENESTFRDVWDSIHNCLKDFKIHFYIKRKQHSTFEESRGTSTSSFVVAQIDFAENFSCAAQDEIAAFHFVGGKQVSIFTCCIWFGSQSQSMAFVSDSLDHNKYAVFVCLQKLMRVIKELCPHVTDVEFFRYC